MKPAQRLFATARAHTPLIHFIGKRVWPSVTTPHPHPNAPEELKASFGDFLKKVGASLDASPVAKKPSSSARSYSDFWEAPSLKMADLADWEVDAVMTGGASSFKHS